MKKISLLIFIMAMMLVVLKTNSLLETKKNTTNNDTLVNEKPYTNYSIACECNFLGPNVDPQPRPAMPTLTAPWRWNGPDTIFFGNYTIQCDCQFFGPAATSGHGASAVKALEKSSVPNNTIVDEKITMFAGHYSIVGSCLFFRKDPPAAMPPLKNTTANPDKSLDFVGIYFTWCSCEFKGSGNGAETTTMLNATNRMYCSGIQLYRPPAPPGNNGAALAEPYTIGDGFCKLYYDPNREKPPV